MDTNDRGQLLITYFENKFEELDDGILVNFMSVDNNFNSLIASELLIWLLRKKKAEQICFLLDEYEVKDFILFMRKLFVSNYFFNLVISDDLDLLDFYQEVGGKNYKKSWRLPHSGLMDFGLAKHKTSLDRYEKVFFENYSRDQGFSLYSGYSVLECVVSYLIQNCENESDSRGWLKIIKASSFGSINSVGQVIENIIALIKIFIRSSRSTNEKGLRSLLTDENLTASIFKKGDLALLPYCDVESAMGRAPHLFI